MQKDYPYGKKARDRWILARRPNRNAQNPRQPVAFLNERERSKSGEIVDVATIFLSNRECPWRCVMCDLWQNTLKKSVAPGDIPFQIRTAIEKLESATDLKLYNSGSFFDQRAIPPCDLPEIAEIAGDFENVVVECHPKLIGKSCVRFRDRLKGRLEVAIGLETASPETLDLLNKGMTLHDFENAAFFLGDNDIDLRVFVLVNPPFQTSFEAADSVRQSIDFAFSCNASVVSLIATRPGNGAMESLIELGDCVRTDLAMLEEAHEYGVRLGKGRVFADLWDLEQFSCCEDCYLARIDRMNRMNLFQQIEPRIRCDRCGEGQ